MQEDEMIVAKALADKLRKGRLVAAATTMHLQGIGEVSTGETREMSHPDALAAADAIDRLILMIGQAEDAMRERCAVIADLNAASSVPLMKGIGVAAMVETGRHRAGTEIATAIRAATLSKEGK